MIEAEPLCSYRDALKARDTRRAQQLWQLAFNLISDRWGPEWRGGWVCVCGCVGEEMIGRQGRAGWLAGWQDGGQPCLPPPPDTKKQQTRQAILPDQSIYDSFAIPSLPPPACPAA
jgi:hypothetical protein